MRVLHIVAYFPPDRMGGVGEVVAHLHAALRGNGHVSHVFTTGTSADDPTVERVAVSPSRFLLALARRAGRARNFELVHCHHGDALLMLLAMRALGIRTPVLATFHVGHRGMAAAHRPFVLSGLGAASSARRFSTGRAGFVYRIAVSRFHRFTDRCTRGLADAVSFISRSAARDVLGGDAGERARVIYNGVPESDPLPAQGNEIPLIELLYVGTDGPRKRVAALPFVLAAVRRDHPAAKLRIVGLEAGAAPDLAALFGELGLGDAVVFEGRHKSVDVERFYRAARVLVVPSIYEGLPMVILEALRCGLPCVATRVSGLPEVVEDGVNGFLVEPDRPELLAERCSRLLADRALRDRFSGEGRAVVASRFGVARQCDEYQALYAQILAGVAGAGDRG